MASDYDCLSLAITIHSMSLTYFPGRSQIRKSTQICGFSSGFTP